MSLFSIFRKNKQEAAPGGAEFTSRAADESQAVRGRRKAMRSDEPADPILPEKKRARRRLVGAIALVLAAVIGLPMLLDSEPKPLAEDIAIQIPTKDKPAPAPVSATQRKSAGTNLAASATLDPSEQIVESAPAVIEDKPAAVAKAMPKAEESAKAPPPKAEVRQEQPKAESKKPEKSESKIAAEKPAADKKDDGARALALLEGKGDAAVKAAGEKKTGKYTVQVAALATQEKINELRGKLSAAGIQSYTQKVATESGERTRIRIGPFATREEAENMRSKLIRMGLSGTLVPPPNS